MVSAPYIYLTVVSDPPGAQVWVDGTYEGITTSQFPPLELYFSNAASHTLRLTLSGDEDYMETGTIATSGTKIVNLSPIVVPATPVPFTPTPVPYEPTPVPYTITPSATETLQAPTYAPSPFISVTFDSVPQGASIWLDDTSRGVTPVTVSFSEPGDHVIDLMDPGFVRYHQKFTVSTSGTMRVSLVPAATVPVTTVSSSSSLTPSVPQTTRPVGLTPSLAALAAGISSVLLMRRKGGT